MIAALLLAAVQTAAPATPQAPPPVVAPAPSPPAAPAVPPVTEWPSLPLYPMPRSATIPEASTYVRAEVEAGRCQPLAPPQADAARVIAPVVVLVGPRGTIRRIVPRAIGCPTVEQYTVGYLLSVTRTGAGFTLPPAPGWYRLTVTYRW
jgi:hypothetical protein